MTVDHTASTSCDDGKQCVQGACSIQEYRKQGNEAFGRRDLAAAIHLYSLALESNDGGDGKLNASIFSNRSLAFYKLGRFDDSAADAEACLRLDPSNQKARYRAALAHLMLGQPQHAEPHMSDLLPPPPHSGSTPQAHLAVLHRVFLAARLHQHCKKRIHGLPPRGTSMRPTLAGTHHGTSHATPIDPVVGRVGELLQELDADLEGEGDADIAAVLQELSPLLVSGPQARAAFEAQRGYPLVLCYFSEAYCHLAAIVLQAASGWQSHCPAEGEVKGAHAGGSQVAPCDPGAAVASGAWDHSWAAGEAAGYSAGDDDADELPTQEKPGFEGRGSPVVQGGQGVVLWPAMVWDRLLSMAFPPRGGGLGSDTRGGGKVTTASLELLSCTAGDPWVRTQVLAHPLHPLPCQRPPQKLNPHEVASSRDGVPALGERGGMGEGEAACPVGAIVARALLAGQTPAEVASAAELLGRYGEDQLSAEALAALRLRPLSSLLLAYEQAEGVVQVASRQLPTSQLGAATTPAGSQLAREQEALERLREKQQEVYNARVVQLRRALLCALGALCSRPELLAAEMPGRAGGGATKADRAEAHVGFLADLVQTVRRLHEQSPKRTCTVLGADGRPKTYSKRPFAADFKDNPAGDFLAGLDLEGASPGDTLDLFAGEGPRKGGRQPPVPGSGPLRGAAAQCQGCDRDKSGKDSRPSLLELALSALLRTVAASGSGTAVAGRLYRLDVLGLCEALWVYCTPSVVELAQRLCAEMAQRHPPALSELLQDGSTMGLAGILQYTVIPGQYTLPAVRGASSSAMPGQHPPEAPCGTAGSTAPATAALPALQLVLRTLDKLAALVDSCSGDEFAHLTQQSAGALRRALQLAQHGSAQQDEERTSRGASLEMAAGKGEDVKKLKGGSEDAEKGHADSSSVAFVPTAEFAGARPGMVFKLGEKGVGYYIDDPNTAAAEAAAAATATELAALALRLRHAAARFVVLCAERAQRQQGIPRGHVPRGGGWEGLSRQVLASLLAPTAPGPGGTIKGADAFRGGPTDGDQGAGEDRGQTEDTPGLASLRKGFLASKGRGRQGRQRAQRSSKAGPGAALRGSPPHAQPGQEGDGVGRVAPPPPSHPGGHDGDPAWGQSVGEQLRMGRPGPGVTIQDITHLEGGRADVAGAHRHADVAAEAAQGDTLAPQGPGHHALHGQPMPGQGDKSRGPQQVQGDAEHAERAWREHQAWLVHQQAEAEAGESEAQEEDEVEELRDVYDSTPSPAIRQIRNAWMARELREKLRWDQTSTDVNAWIVMPMGTRARDVKVCVQPDRLTVSLGWYGRVVDGKLHRRCKASEAQWCLEDNEVHVILPKDDRSYWKALYVDGEEKGYYELLKEAVHADEPATPFDEMDHRAKELLGSMLERQAMINEGLIDPEGFDDFRVVVGENSLVQ